MARPRKGSPGNPINIVTLCQHGKGSAPTTAIIVHRALTGREVGFGSEHPKEREFRTSEGMHIRLLVRGLMPSSAFKHLPGGRLERGELKNADLVLADSYRGTQEYRERRDLHRTLDRLEREGKIVLTSSLWYKGDEEVRRQLLEKIRALRKRP